MRETRARQIQRTSSQDSLPQPPPALRGSKRFAQVAKKTGIQSVIANTLMGAVTHPNRLSSVLNPENRRLLDLQGQRSPEVPRKRLIIGQDSFDLDRDGQLMKEEKEECDGVMLAFNTTPENDCLEGDICLECDKEDSGEGASEAEDELPESESGMSRRALLQHKDSVWSMASSATSVDSNEEDLKDQRRRLQLSLTRRAPTHPTTTTPTTPTTADSNEAPPTTPAESMDSAFLVGM